jgi:hypothetical protein
VLCRALRRGREESPSGRRLSRTSGLKNRAIRRNFQSS